jgi:hypothetical protein
MPWWLKLPGLRRPFATQPEKISLDFRGLNLRGSWHAVRNG